MTIAAKQYVGAKNLLPYNENGFSHHALAGSPDLYPVRSTRGFAKVPQIGDDDHVQMIKVHGSAKWYLLE